MGGRVLKGPAGESLVAINDVGELRGPDIIVPESGGRIVLVREWLDRLLSFCALVEAIRNEDTRRKRGRTVSVEERARRQLLTVRWQFFRENYPDLRSPAELEVDAHKGSIEHFVAWAMEKYDDMPTDDVEKIGRMLNAHRMTPKATQE